MVFLYFFMLCVSLFVLVGYFKQSAFKTINFFSVYTGLFVIFGLISSLIIISGAFDQSYFLMPIASRPDVVKLGAAMQLWAFIGPLGCILVFDLMLKTRLVRRYSSNAWLYSRLRVSNKRLYVLVIATLIVQGIYIVQSYPAVWSLIISGADPLALATRRLSLTKDYEGSGLIKTIALGLSVVYLWMLGYTYSRKGKGRVILLLALFTSIYTLGATGEKAPMVIGIGALFWGKMATRKKVAYLRVGGVLACIVFALTALQFRGEGMSVLDRVAERVFVAQAVAVYLSVDQYERHGSLIGFNSLESSLGRMIYGGNGKVEPASSQYVDTYYPGMRELGTWNVNGIYIYEVLANFGMIWVWLYPIVLGVLMYLLLLALGAQRVTFFGWLFYVFYVTNFAPLLTSVNRLLADTDTLMMAFVLIGLSIISMMIYGKTRHE